MKMDRNISKDAKRGRVEQVMTEVCFCFLKRSITLN
jgi:hypothetical protein